MKKFFAILTALMLAVTGCVLASAEGKTLSPAYDVDMETYGDEGGAVHVSLDPVQVDETGCLIYSVYALDMYYKEDIEALQPGDKLFANDEELTVNTVEKTEYGYEINGGYDETEEGVSLRYVDEDPETLYSMMLDDVASRTLVGQAAYPLADKVTVRTYKMGDDGDYHDEYDEAELDKADVADYLKAKEAEGILFSSPDNTVLMLVNGQVTDITVEWGPNC